MSSISHYLSSASTASSVTSAFSAPQEGIKDILKEIKACSTNILEPKLAADQKSSACASLQVLYEQLLETNQQENLFSNLPRGLSSQELSTYFFIV